ncbi:MAG: hypothetical protein ACOC2L_00920, partial [Candidatus Sumerlaeota bacterium]
MLLSTPTFDSIAMNTADLHVKHASFIEKKLPDEGFSKELSEMHAWGQRVDSIDIPNGPSYALKQSATPYFSFASSGEWIFFYLEFHSIIENGKADSQSQAKRNWTWNFHEKMQELISLRPSQMNEHDQITWYRLLEKVDINL